MDASKYKALFLSQADEHLKSLAAALVGLERAPHEPEHVQTIFRDLHSMKGMAASMHYDGLTQLSHAMESLVMIYREANAAPTAEAVDRLLQGVDALADLVSEVAEDRVGDRPVTDLVVAFDAAAKTAQPGSAAPPAAATPAPAPEAPSSSWVLEVTFGAKAPVQVRAFLLHKRLTTLSPRIQSDPPLNAIRAGHLANSTVVFRIPPDVDEGQLRSLLTGSVDVERFSLQLAERPKAEPAEPAEAKARPAPTSAGAEAGREIRSVRVRTDVLDGLIDSVGELMLMRSRLADLLKEHEDPEVDGVLHLMHGTIRELHHRVMQVRLTPLSMIVDRYPRLVRDVARRLGKDVTFSIEGQAIELDRALLEPLDKALVHVLRNAVDHGIESAERRLEQGKPVAGRLRLSARRDGDDVLIVVDDDGAGIDPQRLRDKAVRLGLYTAEEAATLSDQQALQLVCRSGLSTAEQVSEISGRGVGMDVVKATAESVGGSLLITSELGHSTQIAIKLPLTLAILQMMLVRVERHIFAIPINRVTATAALSTQYVRAAGQARLPFRGELVPVIPLRRLMSLPGVEPTGVAVLMDLQRRLVALEVDELMGTQELVIKPLGEPLGSMPQYAGGTILGTGRPILILDVERALAQSGEL